MKRNIFKRKSYNYSYEWTPMHYGWDKENRKINNRAIRRTLKQQDKFYKGFYEFVESNRVKAKGSD